MHIFPVRDLREHTGDLIRSAENGELSIVTKHGIAVIRTTEEELERELGDFS